jgi:hypothetical protein
MRTKQRNRLTSFRISKRSQESIDCSRLAFSKSLSRVSSAGNRTPDRNERDVVRLRSVGRVGMDSLNYCVEEILKWKTLVFLQDVP